MNKISLATSVALVFSGVLALSAAPVKQHVPDKLDGLRPFSPKAAEHNHIALINAPDAIPTSEWPLVSTYAASRVNLNIWTNDTPKAKVKVYFLRGEPKEGVVIAPGKWAKVDVSLIESDKPDAQTLRDRRAKLVLRTMTQACGGGATLERFCVMFYGANDLKGLDEANAVVSPMCYFPVIESLRRVGGDEITVVAEPTDK